VSEFVLFNNAVKFVLLFW